MVSPSQDLPSNAQALFHDFQSLLSRERDFKPDRRPQERETLDGKERVVLAMRGRVARQGARALALAFIGRLGRGDIDHGDESWRGRGTRRSVGIGIGERWSRIGVPLYICSRRACARGVVVVVTHDGRRDGDRGCGIPVRSGNAAPVQGGAEPAQVAVHPEDEDEQDER